MPLHDLKPEDRAALRTFWTAFEPHHDSVMSALQEASLRLPPFDALLRGVASTPSADEVREGRERLEAALLRDDWEPYLHETAKQGALYAQLGVGFSDWFRIVRLFRRLITEAIAPQPADPVDRQAMTGMALLIDIGMATIGAEYLRTKESIISAQQDTIRATSTPVLQIDRHTLILPLIGVVDTHRARQITESVLLAIRDRRARVVVLDITGVPIVDTRVAGNLLHTTEAARLMGAEVILTGISPEIAQTMVTTGASIGHVKTLGDLQAGLAEAARIVARQSPGIEPATP